MKGYTKLDIMVMFFFLCWLALIFVKHIDDQQVVDNQKNSCFDENGKEVEVIDWSDL